MPPTRTVPDGGHRAGAGPPLPDWGRVAAAAAGWGNPRSVRPLLGAADDAGQAAAGGEPGGERLHPVPQAGDGDWLAAHEGGVAELGDRCGSMTVLPRKSFDASKPPRATKPVAVGPGQRAVTPTPVPRTSSLSASEKERT